jgi:transposase
MSKELSTLYVGIDVSKMANQVIMIDFDQTVLRSFSADNNNVGAETIETAILGVLESKALERVIVVLESTGIYSAHIATYLSASKRLLPYGVHVYTINPKIARNYRASFSDMDKTDPKDAFILADIARVGRTKGLTPFRGAQKLALQRLTRHRVHLSESLSKEKTYILGNIFLKFSEYGKKHKEGKAFANDFSKTAVSILESFYDTEDIVNTPLEDLADFIAEKGRNRFKDPLHTAKLIKKAARDSYRLDKMAYEPINMAISSSLSVIRCLESEIKKVDKTLETLIKGFNTNEYQALRSIPGIGAVFAAGILSEIGSIEQFDSNESLAKYAGITWRKRQSGKFEADDTEMTKTGNHYLRYYLVQAANLTRRFAPEYAAYYQKKFDQGNTHQHKRALALTTRKLIRLIYGLMSKHQLYQR